jgi:hypothetical protein
MLRIGRSGAPRPTGQTRVLLAIKLVVLAAFLLSLGVALSDAGGGHGDSQFAS